ncbi:hypothetical protein DIX60_00965 [Streptococcus iniae]|uniref:prealbumin-like fold domain-containing protein n=1 Tax=Streptococcus iniae TaxID=1346 RepID=UPI0008D9F923|nr:prealbumin-like fold domain-containing protein [Streptococcus iniae]OHX27052.1 hypothetical protein BKX95_07140 [Streptococcus iniae]RLV28564.1 hypothetical protein DIX60_00965 [Streptococcus iniae]
MIKKILTLTLLFLLCAVAPIVVADSVNKTGSISVQMIFGGKGISGGNLLAYQVATAVDRDGNKIFTLKQDFRQSGLIDSDLSQELLQLHNDKNVKALTQAASSATPVATFDVVSENGITATDLPAGLYLFVQNQAVPGYELMRPFLISIPNDGQYNVSALEKMSPLIPKNQATIIPKSPPVKDNVLPFTGQLWWPVPILLSAGLLCFLLSFKWEKRSE